jgi:hypothetical protein
VPEKLAVKIPRIHPELESKIPETLPKREIAKLVLVEIIPPEIPVPNAVLLTVLRINLLADVR